jgi:thiol-disulfide isomerase/thioredoxin
MRLSRMSFLQINRISFMKLLMYILLHIFCSTKIYAQYKIRDSCAAFTLNIEAKNLHSDSIRFLYRDCDEVNYKDTFILSNGKASISGKINRATEGILLTNIRSLWIDGPRVIRFIIEPGKMTLRFTMVNDTARDMLIEGSTSQKQKVAWEADNSSIINVRSRYENEYLQLIHQKRTKDSISVEKKEKIIANKLDDLKESLITLALEYVKTNPYSYFSGYLLYHYRRSMPTDTLQTYFSYLDSKVVNSDFGKNTLEELFKLTDDWVFRKKFSDSLFYKSLKKIKTVYNVSLLDLNGTKTSLSVFKGNFILIDFWASWCGPCIKNAPYLKKLITEMKNKPIKVISISIDDGVDTWKKSIKKYAFPGIHLLDKKGLLSTFYKVLWVPRYVIINPDGTVANMDAPQPIDPQLKLVLDDLLNKKKS